MNRVRVSWSETANLGDYESCKYEISIDVDSEDTWQDVNLLTTEIKELVKQEVDAEKQYRLKGATLKKRMRDKLDVEMPDDIKEFWKSQKLGNRKLSRNQVFHFCWEFGFDWDKIRKAYCGEMPNDIKEFWKSQKLSRKQVFHFCREFGFDWDKIREAYCGEK